MSVTPSNMYWITDSTICEQTEGWGVPSWLATVWNRTVTYSDWVFQSRYVMGVMMVVRGSPNPLLKFSIVFNQFFAKSPF